MAVNGVYIVQGELNAVVAMLRRGAGSMGKSASAAGMLIIDEQDPLLRGFADLRDVLNRVNDLADMAPSSFLSPFLEVILSEHTTGPVTGQALAALSKFLSYGLVDPDSLTAASAVQQIADAVTHARFVGIDAGSDEVVLLRILQVLRALLLTPVGALLTDESVCEILQSCFRICFETRLSQLLRKAAESCITDMSQLLFTRLPTFAEDPRHPYIRRLKMRAGHKAATVSNAAGQHHQNGKQKLRKRSSQATSLANDQKEQATLEAETNQATEIKTDIVISSEEAGAAGVLELAAAEPSSNEGGRAEQTENISTPSEEKKSQLPSVVVDVHGNLGFDSDECSLSRAASNCDIPGATTPESAQPPNELTANAAGQLREGDNSAANSVLETFTNDSGVRFTAGSTSEITGEKSSQQDSSVAVTTSVSGSSSSAHPRAPYGLPCVRELLRFLVALVNPLEHQNTEYMLELGLNLLTVALEAGADHLGNYSLLLPLIQNELCRALVALVSNPYQKPTIFAGATRVGFLVFEALRTHLKFQFEAYLTKLMDLVTATELATVTGVPGQQSTAGSGGSSPVALGMPVGIRSEQKELALEALVQMWRVPGLVTELYLNYDCDLYCANLFEEMTKLLSKNAFPAAGLTGAHLLSLDGLLTVVDTIETNCHFRMLNYKENQLQQQPNLAALALDDANRTAAGQQPAIASECRRVSSPSRLLPAASGYSAGKSLPFASVNSRMTALDPTSNVVPPEVAEVLRLPQIRPNRMPITSTSIPSHEDLIAQKQKKRLLATGTELFNQQPSKGVQFLQEHGLLRTPLCPDELVVWLKENPRLDKRKIAEYIVNRKNTKILEAFVRSFDFKSQRIDESLRNFLETFRLPGEAAEISMVIEHFADHWFKSNNCPFSSVDAAFTLAYAVIMLNVDQHNQIAKRQQQPMTTEAFKRNLNGVNGGGNFDQSMLEEIYNAIRSEEIVMPAEHTGLIKENYLWKVLLKRAIIAAASGSCDSRFVHAPSGLYDHDLFTLVWGPTVAAVSFVFDKSQDEGIVAKAIGGFRKCAAIAAHYGMSDVFDNLIINLCKFSTIASASSVENPDQLGVAFGENTKAHLATKAMFQLVHHHGDILREGWKNLLDCLGHLFRSQLLPVALTEVEDYADPKGRVSILKETQKQLAGRKPPKSESGIFSSLYSWVGGGADTKEGRGPTPEELELIRQSKHIIQECHPEQLVTDSKYLTSEALAEFLKSLVVASISSTSSPDGHRNTNGNNNGALSEAAEQAAVFHLELIISVAVENRDRLTPFWRTIRSHLFSLLSDFGDSHFLTERAIVGLLRLATRLLSREELTDEVLQSLAMLRTLKFGTVSILSRQMAFGLHELLRTNAANIHKSEHWKILFQLLETIGAAAYDYADEQLARERENEIGVYPTNVVGSQSDTEEGNQKEDIDRGYTSDSEVYEKKLTDVPNLSRASSGGVEEWTYVEKMGASLKEVNVEKTTTDGNGAAREATTVSLVLRSRLRRHDPRAYIKCCETLTFLVRDAAHITPENFDSCVRCLRTFIEAGLNGGWHYGAPGWSDDIDHDGGSLENLTAGGKKRKTRSQRNEEEHQRQQRRRQGSDSTTTSDQELDDEARRQLSRNYDQLSLRLLDLTHSLHVKASIIYRSWAEANPGLVDASSTNLWTHCWRPLLQALARLCCDRRKEVRSAALTYLQRSLLTHDLQELNAVDWGNCFNDVLFPLLGALIDESVGGIADRQRLQQQAVYDEIRVRASTLVSKVYLQHLCPLSASPSFTPLWLTLLDFMERYLRINSGDLNESVPESVKNLLLVMDTAGVFRTIPGLVIATKERLMSFLPDLANGLTIQEAYPVVSRQDEMMNQSPPTADYSRATTDVRTSDAISAVVTSPMPDYSRATTDVRTSDAISAVVTSPMPVPVAPLEEVIVVQDHHHSRQVYPAYGELPSHCIPRDSSPPGARASSLTRFGTNVTSPTSVDLMPSLIQQTPPSASRIVLHPPAPGTD